jgi:hypothetical protein
MSPTRGFEELLLRTALQHMVSGQGSTVHSEFHVHTAMHNATGSSLSASRDQFYQALYGYLRLLRLGNAPGCATCESRTEVRVSDTIKSLSQMPTRCSSQGLRLTFDGVKYFGKTERTHFLAEDRAVDPLPLTGL